MYYIHKHKHMHTYIYTCTYPITRRKQGVNSDGAARNECDPGVRVHVRGHGALLSKLRHAEGLVAVETLHASAV